MSSLALLKKFIPYYKPQMKIFVLDLIAAFLTSACDLLYPILSRTLINDYIPQGNVRILWMWAVALLLIYLAKAALTYFMQYLGHQMSVDMQADMRRDAFVHLQKLPFSYYDEHETGTIMSRMINDLMDISELAHHGPEDLFISLVLIIGSFIYLCTINVYLTLMIFAVLPFLVFFAIKMRLRMNRAFMESRVTIGEVNATLQSSISGIRVAKAFTNSEFETKKFQEGNHAFRVARVFAYKTMAEFAAGTSFIIDFLNVVVLAAGGYFASQHIISFGDLVAYMLCISMFLTPIKKLINFVEQYQSGVTGFRRFVEIMETEPEKEAPGAKPVDHIHGDITFSHVNFHYKDGKKILDDLNLHIPAGKTVALVGPSGGGKTTICHLIPNFYQVDSGSITIDGIDNRNITFESLRQNIGIVQQDVFLFSGSIKENIAYGNFNASDEEIIAAAKRANIHNYVMGLEHGYDTQIGERGVKLSGGQKQRLAIARVFLKNPPILILDEATSALDNTTEILIQKALDDLCRDRTTLVVAHRLSTIKNADQILVVTRDGIVEQGTHDELLAKNGVYSTLYQAQFSLDEDAQ